MSGSQRSFAASSSLLLYSSRALGYVLIVLSMTFRGYESLARYESRKSGGKELAESIAVKGLLDTNEIVLKLSVLGHSSRKGECKSNTTKSLLSYLDDRGGARYRRHASDVGAGSRGFVHLFGVP